MFVRRLDAVLVTRLIRRFFSALLGLLLQGSRAGLRCAQRSGRGLVGLVRHPRTQRGASLALLIGLMLINAAATFNVNDRTWDAAVLGVTNGASTLTIIVAIVDRHRNAKK